MTGRGGARHVAKPHVDVDVLFRCLEKHKDLVADLGAYEHISRSYAPNPQALLNNMALWKDLLKVEPSGEISARPLRQSLLSLLAAHPSLHSGELSGDVWCNLKVRRLTVMLAHVRSLGKGGQALVPVAGKLASVQYQNLLDGLKLFDGHNLGKDSQTDKPAGLGKGKSEAAAGLGKGEGEAASSLGKGKEYEARLGKAKRVLEGATSNASLDSQGMRNMFKSPKAQKAILPTAEEQPLEKGNALALVSLQRPGSRLHLNLGYGLEKSKAKAKAKPNGKAKAKAKAKADPKAKVLKKPSASLGKGSSEERQPWELLKQTFPRNPERSYIQGKYKDGKLHLIVEVSAKQSPNYLAIIGKIRQALEKDSLTKQEALDMRNRLLQGAT